ncbi:hypothetical protein V1505DRAFT_381821 [Lipomyces doorenjongii]
MHMHAVALTPSTWKLQPTTRPRRQPAVDYLLVRRRGAVQNVSVASGRQSTIESTLELGPEDSIGQIVYQPLSRTLIEEAQGHDLS